MRVRKSYWAKRSCVYVATNLVNEKRYVGVTCRYLCHRKYHHFRAARKGSPFAFHRAIRKYGKDSFIFTVISWHEKFEDARAAEVKTVAFLKPEYNMTRGGDGSHGYKHTEEMRRQISARNKGQVGPWRGKGVPPGFQVPYTEERRRKIGGANKGRKRTLEQIRALRKARGYPDKFEYNGIVCLNDGKQYLTVSEAAKYYGCDEGSISSVCNHSTKTAKGLVFRFFGEHSGGKDEADRIIADLKEARSKGAPRYKKPVIRTADNMLYETVEAAAEASGVGCDSVIRSCKHRYRYNSRWKDAFVYLDEWCPNPL